MPSLSSILEDALAAGADWYWTQVDGGQDPAAMLERTETSCADWLNRRGISVGPSFVKIIVAGAIAEAKIRRTEARKSSRQ